MIVGHAISSVSYLLHIYCLYLLRVYVVQCMSVSSTHGVVIVQTENVFRGTESYNIFDFWFHSVNLFPFAMRKLTIFIYIVDISYCVISQESHRLSRTISSCAILLNKIVSCPKSRKTLQDCDIK